MYRATIIFKTEEERDYFKDHINLFMDLVTKEVESKKLEAL